MDMVSFINMEAQKLNSVCEIQAETVQNHHLASPRPLRRAHICDTIFLRILTQWCMQPLKVFLIIFRKASILNKRHAT